MCKYIPAKATCEHLLSAVIKRLISFHAVKGLGRYFWKVPASLQMLVLE